MSGLVFFDSNIIIDHLNKVGAERQAFLAHPNAAISAIVWMEVLVGDIDTPYEADARRALSLFRKVEITLSIQERAARVRQRHRIKLPDAIIYATAEEQNAVLMTRDAKDFPADPRVVVPYRV